MLNQKNRPRIQLMFNLIFFFFFFAFNLLILSECSPKIVLTAEFHGIWESLVYESGIKTQVKTIKVDHKMIP